MTQSTLIKELYAAFLNCGQKICTDTRKIEKGAIFFALKGSNFNGNEYALKALEQGCLCAVIDEAQFSVKGKTFLAEDVLQTLQQLANYHRRQLSIPFLAITGSNAKTTNKELINAVLSRKYKTLATAGNLNNHIGVPLTLLSITKEHEFAIIEMGANHQKEIDALCNIAEPDYGMITNIGKAHLEGFGGIEGVKKGKSEMYRFIESKKGKIFINADDDVLMDLAKNNDKITFGSLKLYDVIGKDVTNTETVSLKYTTRYGEKDWNKLSVIHTRITGAYNFINCLAAACIGNYFKVSDADIKSALEAYLPEMNRSQLVNTAKNVLLLDAYNANPNSMRAAIENFARYKADRKLLLLGDMFELGEFSEAEHTAIVTLLQELKLNNSFLVGENFSNLHQNIFTTFKSTEQCRAHLESKQFEGYTILIKGSRGMKMESLRDVL